MAETRSSSSLVGVNSATNHLVLLPGLDGTGQLFAGFLQTLPKSLTVTVVAYPTNEHLLYAELRSYVSAAVPKAEPFALLAESFSAPIAVEYAATNPSNLTAVIISTGFVFRPLGGWSKLANAIAQPWFFSLKAPRWVLEHALIGSGAPRALTQKLRQVLQLVNPSVLSGRVHEALNCDARSELARTSVPLLYLQAAEDRVLSESCVREMKRIRPGISFAAVEGPHLLLQREPQKVADIVLKFIQEAGN